MTDEAEDRAYLLDGAEDIGHEHWIRRTSWTPPALRSTPPLINEDDPTEPYGLIVVHRRPDNGKLCASGLTWVDDGSDRPRWVLHSLDPLHIEPSILCRATETPDGPQCGDHGFIRDGVWVVA